MVAELLPVDPLRPDPAILARAASILRRGGLVAFPTETVYGLGASALDMVAVGRIYAAKGRPARNPLIVHVAGTEEALRLVTAWPDEAQRLAEAFWPGPLTLVLPRSSVVPFAVTAGGSTVAIRSPAHPVARALIQATGIPLAAPSANSSTRLSPTTARHVNEDLGDRIDLILDAGPASGGLESTVLDLTVTPPRVLRPGLIERSALEAVIGTVSHGPRTVTAEAAPVRSPGLLHRHYAPLARLECAADDGWSRVETLCRAGNRVGWLALDPPRSPNLAGLTVITMSRNSAAYAARLYAALHELDAAGVEHIVVGLLPDTEAWLAVHDRLRRASTAP